jgi:TPR repeat protein
MSSKLVEFLEKYEWSDLNISLYDNDTIQMITEIFDGQIDNYSNSDNGIALLCIGLYCRFIKKDNHSAEKYYLLAAKDEQHKSTALTDLGNLHHKQHQLDLAENYYLMAIENDNNYSRAMCNLACLYQNQNKLDLAEKYYLMAIENGQANSNQRLHMA